MATVGRRARKGVGGLLMVAAGVVSGIAIAVFVLINGLGYRRSAPPNRDGSVTPPESNPVLARLDLADRDKKLQSELESEPRDQVWASASEAALKNALVEVGEGAEFSVGATECRTTRCRSELHWATFDRARATHATVAHARLPMACSRTILVLEPANPQLPYSATAYFTCERGEDPKR